LLSDDGFSLFNADSPGKAGFDASATTAAGPVHRDLNPVQLLNRAADRGGQVGQKIKEAAAFTAVADG